jgi:cytochrome oxidase assembly protein ShyY1
MIRQLPDSGLARFPVRRAPEPYNERMHFSYAFQWFFFAAVLLLAAFFIMMQADPARPKPPG